MNNPHDIAQGLRTEFSRCMAQAGADVALARLGSQLEGQPLAVWLECASEVAAQPAEPAAAIWLHRAAARWPQVPQLHYWLAGMLWNLGQAEAAEHELRATLALQPEHREATQLLATLLRNGGRLGAAAQLMYEFSTRQVDSLDAVLRGAAFIRHCQRHALAAQLCAEALQRGLVDAALHAQAGMLALERGRFEEARNHLLEALARGVDVNAWLICGALALAQKYRSEQHPDFALFRAQIADSQLSVTARTATQFALAKACDDVGRHTEAAALWRQANAQARIARPWSRERFRNDIDALLRSHAAVALPVATIVPVFVVGLPRSGTTLTAVTLARYAGVRDRGELPHLAFIAERLASGGHRADRQALAEAAQLYYAHLRQDDAPARWYIDKTPTNFLRLDLVAEMFPQAHVVHCRRNRRDTALSLYAQNFAHADGDFSYDFAGIAAFAEGHDELMEHWRRTLPLPIHNLDYEALVQRPAEIAEQLRRQIGIDSEPGVTEHAASEGAIASSSLWQAKQPVYTSSVGRWRAYAPYLTELEALFPDRTL